MECRCYLTGVDRGAHGDHPVVDQHHDIAPPSVSHFQATTNARVRNRMRILSWMLCLSQRFGGPVIYGCLTTEMRRLHVVSESHHDLLRATRLNGALLLQQIWQREWRAAVLEHRVH